MAEEIKKINSTVTKMADRRKQIEKLYDGTDESLRRIFDKSSGSGIGNRYTEEYLDRIFRGVGTENLDESEIYDLSNYAYATDPNFAGLIDYYANMFLWRYYFIPVSTRKGADPADYADVYNLMTEVVDGLAIEVTFPTLITKLFKEGAIYLYTTKNRSSKTLSTVVLNPEYCRPVMMSQYGTGVFQFDLWYFDHLVLAKRELEEVFPLFPDEVVEKYKEYKEKKGPRFVILDGRYSTYIALNDYRFPNRLTVLRSLFDYNQYRKNELERSTAQLDKIITHRIPSYENRLLFELSEVKALHTSMSKILSANKRTKLITTFGDVELHSVQEEGTTSNQVLKKAQEGIYRSAGVNTGLFASESAQALLTSLQRDESVVWRYIQILLNFYNLTINNLYSFKGYQIELTMLPITHYNLKEMMEIQRRNAEYGIGRLEAIVASGTKQKHITHKGKLEEFLKLDEILKPLASSHTRSTEEPDTQVEEEEVDVEEIEEIEDSD